MPDALRLSQTTNQSTSTMNMTDFLHLPFVEVLKLLVKGSVEEYLAEKEATSSTANQTAAKTECESLDMKGALEFLNSNGYPIKKGHPIFSTLIFAPRIASFSGTVRARGMTIQAMIYAIIKL